MNGTMSAPGHDLKYSQGEYEDFDEQGKGFIRLTGRMTYYCSCGAKGAGINSEMAAAIAAHLGIEWLASRERELEQRRQWVEACQRQEREHGDG